MAIGDITDPLLDVLLPIIPEEKRLNLHFDPEEKYLAHVKSLPQENIAAERQFLETSRNATETTLGSLAFSSHEQIAKGSKAVTEFVSIFDQFKLTADEFYHVHLSDVQDLSTTYKGNSSTSGPLSEDLSQSKDLLILRNLDKIQDLLEIPTLALACVRNGYYSETLDLAAHVKRIGIRFGNLSIISSIDKEIEKVLETMQTQLTQQLCEGIKLPKQIKIMGYLKRMKLPADENGERKLPSSAILQHLYLVCRLQYLRNLYSSIESLKTSSPASYLKKYIEFFREHTFSTITGFQPIFGTHSDPKLISEFLKTAVEELYNEIVELSPVLTDLSVRSSLWLQLAYCSQSLGRVGGEFWPAFQERSDCLISKQEWEETIQKRLEISQRLSQILK